MITLGALMAATNVLAVQLTLEVDIIPTMAANGCFEDFPGHRHRVRKSLALPPMPQVLS